MVCEWVRAAVPSDNTKKAHSSKCFKQKNAQKKTKTKSKRAHLHRQERLQEVQVHVQQVQVQVQVQLRTQGVVLRCHFYPANTPWPF